MIKELVIKVLGEKYARQWYMYFKGLTNGFSTRIYSQEGEDLILKEFLSDVKKGFYVDVGAHHPIRFSNTYMFYKMGWNGINIDAMPGSMKAFDRRRPRDINLEMGVSDKKGFLTYYMFDEPALNSFSKELSEERDNNSNFKIVDKKRVKTYPLSYILNKYLPKGKVIDFMSIDVEGLDLMVLKSNDWNRYSPTFILVESIGEDIEDILKGDVYTFLKNKGYTIVGKTYRTLVFGEIDR